MSRTLLRYALILILVCPLMAVGFYTATQARLATLTKTSDSRGRKKKLNYHPTATQTGNRNTSSPNSNTGGNSNNSNSNATANSGNNNSSNANSTANANGTGEANVNDNSAGKDNGITVGQPKQFDERTLTLMLQGFENRLALTQFPDPNALYANVGRFGGASATTTSMALSVRGPATPTVATTLGNTVNSGTNNSVINDITQNTNNSTSVTQNANSSTTNTSSGDSVVDKTTNSSGTTGSTSNTFQQQITQPGLAPPTAAAPPQTSFYSYQPQFGISAQDLLAEQTALFYQITNLRLLLDRSLSDRISFTPKDGFNIGSKRDQIVIGFQITIEAEHKDAVAESEIAITGPDVSLVSLLPMDKTYNVASVTKSSKAVDVGAVVQLIGVGAAVGKTQESIYLIKDTDTVSLERPVDNSEIGKTIKFAWQFRPVLGQRTVEPGRRQVFALISVPQGGDVMRALKVTATTKWRRYDRKLKSVGDLVSGTTTNVQYRDQTPNLSDPSSADFGLKPYIFNVGWNDTGTGQVLAIVEGSGFTPDTSLVLGNTVLNRPENGLTVANERRMIILAPAQLLARSLPLLVGRYGTTEFTRPKCMSYPDILPTPTPATTATSSQANGVAATASTTSYDQCVPGLVRMVETYSSDLKLEKPQFRPRDASNFEVTLTLKAQDETKGVDMPYRFKYHRPVVVIGDRVFGLSDAPFISTVYDPKDETQKQKKSVSFTFVAPAQLLANHRTLTVKEFLWNHGELSTDYTLSDRFNATGVTTLGSNGEKVQLAISGSGFSNKVRVMVGDVPFQLDCKGTPDCVSGLWLNADDGTATLLTLSPTKAQMKDVKHIIVLQGKAPPQTLALTQPPPPVPTAKIIKPSEPFNIGEGDSRQIRFEGANFESIKKVLFRKQDVDAKPDPDDKTAYLVTLEEPLTKGTGTKELVFVMKDDKEVRFTVIVK